MAPPAARATFPGQTGLIAFESRRDGNPEIYVMNPDGSGQTRLTESDGEDIAATWSPDGRKLTWWSSRDGN